MSATPRSTWNAPANSGCVAVLLGAAAPPEEFAREFARFAPQLSFADEASLFRTLEGLRPRRGAPNFVGDTAIHACRLV